jgi:DNA-binding GntR family transcriptional regulator
VVAMAANRLLSELFESTRSRIRWLLGQHTDLGAMAAEHAELYQALLAREGDRAGALAEAHLVTSRRAALAHRVAGAPTTPE